MKDRLKKLLEILNLSQKEFSQTIGVTQATISRYLNGRDIDSKVAVSIKDKFNVNLDWLLTGSGDIFLINKPEKKSIKSNSGDIVIGTQNKTINNNYHSTLVNDEEQAILDRLRKIKDSKIKNAIKVMLGIDN